MKELNTVLINNKFMVSFWSFQRSYYERGRYNKHMRMYKRLRKLTDLEQYITKITISTTNKSIEGIGLFNKKK